MSQPEAPKIEFPCENYPIKVVGEAMETYEEVIVEIVRVHAEDCDMERIRIQESSIHKDLMAHANVRMVI